MEPDENTGDTSPPSLQWTQGNSSKAVLDRPRILTAELGGGTEVSMGLPVDVTDGTVAPASLDDADKQNSAEDLSHKVHNILQRTDEAPSAFHPSSDQPRFVRKWFRLEGTDVTSQSSTDESVTEELGRLGAVPLNFIMICGPARKGKSFLMNMIARLGSAGDGVFPVSGQNVACTNGVDIAPTVVPLAALSATSSLDDAASEMLVRNSRPQSFAMRHHMRSAQQGRSSMSNTRACMFLRLASSMRRVKAIGASTMTSSSFLLCSC